MTQTSKNSASEDLARLQRWPHAAESWQHAQRHLRAGNHAAALAIYRNLAQMFPGVPQLWAELGSAAAGDLDFTEADLAFRRAMELAPSDAKLLVFLFTQYYHLRRLDQALACLRRAVEADPGSVDVRLTLATWLERIRHLDEAWDCIETCPAQHPKNVQVLFVRAFLLHRKGLNEEAETALRDLLKTVPLPSDVLVNAYHLLGVVLDALGQYDEALIWLGKSKTLRRQTVDAAALEQAYEKTNQARRQLLAELKPETMRRWREESAATPCPHPLALLGGAMRSGTTLIEQIFGAHPDILVFDESMPSLAELLKPLNSPPPTPGLTLTSLNALTAARRAQLTGRYLKSLLREVEEEPGNSVLLDKNPSTTAWLPVWLRFFPQSKIIITLRDPRDVVISCHFQNVQADWGIVNFASLEKTAKFYALSMDVWLRMRELGGFDWIETRYEDMVGNLEAEGRRVTNFLGLPWHEAQAKYYETTRRKFVHSPTYGEVTQPIHNRAVRRWEHYAEALAPLQASLEPYLQAFGYS
ncbi:MAG: tetratricopeptide repeat-containing sulfotransferase family protein [Limisphaerales bacterium]